MAGKLGIYKASNGTLTLPRRYEFLIMAHRYTIADSYLALAHFDEKGNWTVAPIHNGSNYAAAYNQWGTFVVTYGGSTNLVFITAIPLMNF